MKTFISSFVLITALLFSSCSTVSVSFDYDRNANFTNYKTFTFHDKGLKELNMNSLDKNRVVRAIGENLSVKGLSLVEGKADLIVSISAANKNRVVVDNNWYDPWFFGPYWHNPTQVRQYREGTLVIDLVDAKNNTLVWQGIGSGLNLDNLEAKAEAIPLAVNKILNKFPPKQQ